MVTEGGPQECRNQSLQTVACEYSILWVPRVPVMWAELAEQGLSHPGAASPCPDLGMCPLEVWEGRGRGEGGGAQPTGIRMANGVGVQLCVNLPGTCVSGVCLQLCFSCTGAPQLTAA